MSKIEKRLYQIMAANKGIATKDSLLIVAPGGSGKTIIAALITEAARKARKRVLLVAHRREIITQTAETLKQFGEKPSIIMGEDTDEQLGPVIVASVPTLTSRNLHPDVDIVIIDEAHRAAAKSYADLIEYYKSRGVPVIGLSATPYRLDGLGLGMFFNNMYEAAKPSQLLGKYIMKPRVFSAPPEHLPVLLDLGSFKGDFKLDDLVKRINTEGLIGGIVEMVQKHWQPGNLGVAFCVSIQHSKSVADALTRAGFRARHVDGTLSTVERDQLLEDLRARRIDIITCCMLLSEGWDLPECDMVILARPTRSISLYIQMANRGARVGKNTPIILDHACNTVMHGYSWTDRSWDLHGKIRGNPRQLQTLKLCEACGCINPAETEACQECGCQLKKPRVMLLSEQKDLELVEWNEAERARRLKRIREFAAERGFGENWVKDVEAMWSP